MGYVLFGWKVEGFSTLSASVMTCQEIILGALRLVELTKADKLATPFFTFFFCFTMTFILMDIFIAIMETSYYRVRNSSNSIEKMPNVCVTFIAFMKKKYEDWTRPKKRPRPVYVKKPEYNCVYLFKEIRSSIREMQPFTFASLTSEVIIMERARRKEYDKYF